MAEVQVDFPEKLLPGLFEHHDYKILHGGRGGAKSHSIARALLILGMKRPMSILCVRETQKSIRESCHRLLGNLIAELGLASFYRVQQIAITGLNGTSFSFLGLSDQTADSLKSFEAADACWVEEGHVVSEHSWRILLPTLFRRKDCEVWVSFNPELDTDPVWRDFVETCPEDTWRREINWRDNPFFPQELDKLRRHQKATLSEADYNWIWEGKCRPAVSGAIYTSEMTELLASDRIRDLPWDPLSKVHTFWDTGFNDRTAIIMVQKNATQLSIIDYHEDNHNDMAGYAAVLKERTKYNWGSHWLPWDASGERYRLTDPKTSPEGMLRGLMPGVVNIVPKASVEIGISKARMTFPRCYFDKKKTTRLLECFKRYRRTIPSTTGEPSGPAHDEYSHGADAFRYLAMACDHLTNDDVMSGPIKYPKLAYA